MSLWGSIVTSIVVAVVAIESRYVISTEADAVHNELIDLIEQRATKKSVKDFHTLYIEEQIDGLKFSRFQITKKATLTPDDQYSIQQIDSRLDKLERLLPQH